MRHAYPYLAIPEPKGGFISFTDIPEAPTAAATDAEIEDMARDALVTAPSFHADAGRPIPAPSHGRPLAGVPVLVALKLAPHDAMLAQGVSNVALARQMGTDEKAVRRMRDPAQNTRVDSLEAALRLLGRRVEASVLEGTA